MSARLSQIQGRLDALEAAEANRRAEETAKAIQRARAEAESLRIALRYKDETIAELRSQIARLQPNK